MGKRPDPKDKKKPKPKKMGKIVPDANSWGYQRPPARPGKTPIENLPAAPVPRVSGYGSGYGGNVSYKKKKFPSQLDDHRHLPIEEID